MWVTSGPVLWLISSPGMWLLSRPGAWLWNRSIQRRNDIRLGRRRVGRAPRTLKSRRKRALTPPLPRNSRRKQQTHPQSQSPIFAKFSPELRRLIWEECLGGKTLHLRICDRRVRHIVCPSPVNAQSPTHECWLSGGLPALEAGSGHRLLSLLLTCRRACVECARARHALSNVGVDTRKPLISYTAATRSTSATQTAYSTSLSSSYRNGSTPFGRCISNGTSRMPRGSKKI